MKLTKREIDEELAHRVNLIRTYRTRLKPLEIQAAQKGINAPAEISTEISTIIEQIRIQEDEIENLESLAAEGQLSLAESEYKLLLAEAWDSPIGRPTIAGAARLEFARLKMGISPERAKELEQFVRLALIEDIFQSLDLSLLLGHPSSSSQTIGAATIEIRAEGESRITFDNIVLNQQFNLDSSFESALRILGKAIRLNHEATLELFLRGIPSDINLDIIMFASQLREKNKVWVSRDESVVFDDFLQKLTNQLNLPALLVVGDSSHE